MKSLPEEPLRSISLYLQKGIFESNRQFYDQIEELGDVEKVDKENHEIYVKDIAGLMVYSFEDAVDRELQPLLFLSESYLEKKFEDKFEQGTEQQYVVFLNKQIDRYRSYSSYSEFPFVEKYLIQIQRIIKHFSSESSEKIIQFESSKSFNLTIEDSDLKTAKIQKLYTLMILSPPLVKCEPHDFFQAFSGGFVEEGIDWLIRGKNGHTSKSSLYYFLNLLIKKGYLPQMEGQDLSSKIFFVFRDAEGLPFQNLSQSNYGWLDSKNPTEGKRLQSLVEQL